MLSDESIDLSAAVEKCYAGSGESIFAKVRLAETVSYLKRVGNFRKDIAPSVPTALSWKEDACFETVRGVTIDR